MSTRKDSASRAGTERTPTALAAVGVVLVMLLGAGCTVTEPDPPKFNERVHHALTTVASEVAAVRLTMVQLRDDRMWQPYAVVATADAEKAVSKAEQRVSTVQTPDRRAQLSTRALDLMSRAGDVVRAARTVAVDGRPVKDPLLRRLDDVKSDIDRQLGRR